MSTLVITAVPDFVSADAIASTPASFGDVPPVLRHTEENVSVSLDPPLDGFTPEDGASGVLYIIESALVFMSSTGLGLQVMYPAITLHAISRAQGSGPSIYCQLDETDASRDVPDMRELFIVPQNPSSLEPIFEAMSLCASLHPDPDMSEEDELDGDVIADDHFDTLVDEEEEPSKVGPAALAYLESIVRDPDDRVNGTLNAVDRVFSGQDETRE